MMPDQLDVHRGRQEAAEEEREAIDEGNAVATALQPAAERPLAVATDQTPMGMLDRAIASGASIEVLERLMALQEKWQSQQARMAFSAALAALRGDLPKIVKGQEVDFSSQKGRTHYRYADLASIIEAISAPMAKHGLSFRWRTETTQAGQVSVTCIVEHAEGHAEETTLTGPYDTSGNKNAIQAIGSVTSYLQRYTLQAGIGIAAAADDDGRQGTKPNEAPARSRGPARREVRQDQRSNGKPEVAPATKAGPESEDDGLVCLQFHADVVDQEWKDALEGHGFTWVEEKFSWRAKATDNAIDFARRCLVSRGDSIKWHRIPETATS